MISHDSLGHLKSQKLVMATPRRGNPTVGGSGKWHGLGWQLWTRISSGWVHWLWPCCGWDEDISIGWVRYMSEIVWISTIQWKVSMAMGIKFPPKKMGKPRSCKLTFPSHNIVKHKSSRRNWTKMKIIPMIWHARKYGLYHYGRFFRLRWTAGASFHPISGPMDAISGMNQSVLGM